MKTLNLIFASMITATLMISFPVLSLAHSEHNDSPMPLVWEFNDSVRDKIIRALNDEARKNKVGLSHLEQNILKRYGIPVGHSFYTPVDGRQVVVQRTHSGLRILETMAPVSSEFRWQAPITQRYRVVPSSFPVMDHPGHHHNHLDFSWLFDPQISSKIKRHLKNNAYPTAVGLSSTEQMIVDRYGIKTGNSFITIVGGEDYLVRRTSSGLQIMKKVTEATPVAAHPKSSNRNEIKG